MPDAANAGEAAELGQDLGFGAFWLGGSPQLPSVRPLLAATEGLIVATGIVDLWQQEPANLAHEQAEITQRARAMIGEMKTSSG